MTLLLIIIYTAFIGLGIPDSLIGSAWPAIYTEFGMPVESISGITLLISGCTVLSSIFSAGILNRFGTAKVTAVSTAMTAISLLGISFAPHYLMLLPLAAVLGLGAGAVDAGLNNYISLNFKAGHINYLHCFYGIGVALSPYLMSLALSDTDWRSGYRYAFIIQLVITLIVAFSIPLWKKPSSESADEEDGTSVTLKFTDMLKKPEILTVWVLMMVTNMIEYACGTWGSTYLVSSRGFAPEQGAIALTLYYGGMAVGRFLSGLLSEKIPAWRRIGIGTGIVFAAAVVMLLPFDGVFAVVGLCLMGLGNGSIYPNLIHLTPYNFGRENSLSVMSTQIAFAYIGVMAAPPLVGFVTGLFGMESYPVLLAALFAVMAVSIAVLIKLLKRRGRYDPKA
nr:MFS transporter [Clostridia bacterium]